MEEIVSAAQHLDRQATVKALIITGEGTKAFAAGADIKEMASQTYSQVHAASAWGLQMGHWNCGQHHICPDAFPCLNPWRRSCLTP